jgi:hypothetical protein
LVYKTETQDVSPFCQINSTFFEQSVKSVELILTNEERIFQPFKPKLCFWTILEANLLLQKAFRLKGLKPLGVGL